MSRVHTKVILEGTRWSIQDADSTNGTFLNGNKIEQEELPESAEVELGRGGPILKIISERSDRNSPDKGSVDSPKDSTITNFLKHLKDENAGQYTIIMRKALQRVKKKQSKLFLYILMPFVVALLVLIG